MELEHNFYGVNFAPFPRRGALNSETAHRSMAAMVEATAANWVILSPSGIQSGPYSEEIDWRTDATPTDEELCGAIRFAKQFLSSHCYQIRASRTCSYYMYHPYHLPLH